MSESGQYSTVDVPILHKDWHGEYSLSSVFLNLKLMGVSHVSYLYLSRKWHLLVTQLYVALIRGPRAGRLFMSGESIQPQTETMAGIHSIRNITPGAIATCAILVHYCHLYCWFSISNSLSGSLGAFSRWHSSGSRLEYRNTILQWLRRVPHDSWDRATTKEEERH